MITIVDYGIGNVASVANMLRKNGIESELTSDASKIQSAQKIILPGVGAFDTAMKKLQELNLITYLHEYANQGKLLLGICLGAQLLMESSEEGVLPGLGLIKGTCKHFGDIHPLFNFDDWEPRFYFTHSYYLACAEEGDSAGTAIYGKAFTCATLQKNIFGVQFHPEKSHRFGSRLLQNFAAL